MLILCTNMSSIIPRSTLHEKMSLVTNRKIPGGVKGHTMNIMYQSGCLAENINDRIYHITLVSTN